MDPVKVSTSRKKITVSIPSIDGGLVTLYRAITVEDQLTLQKVSAGDASASFDDSFAIIQKCFVEWNLQNDAGTIYLFDVTNFRKLCTQMDFLSILQAVTGVQVLSDDGMKILNADEIQKKALSA